jgi:predicted transcriptional regulator
MVVLVITEKQAALSFPYIGGTPDVAAFFGSDSAFLKWTKDLYLHYWEQGEKLHKNTTT